LRNRRSLFRDPPPLPEGAPEYASAFTRKRALEDQRLAKAKMMEFDRQEPEVREMMTVAFSMADALYALERGWTPERTVLEIAARGEERRRC
jgi:hypothetical protein